MALGDVWRYVTFVVQNRSKTNRICIQECSTRVQNCRICIQGCMIYSTNYNIYFRYESCVPYLNVCNARCSFSNHPGINLHRPSLAWEKFPGWGHHPGVIRPLHWADTIILASSWQPWQQSSKTVHFELWLFWTASSPYELE